MFFTCEKQFGKLYYSFNFKPIHYFHDNFVTGFIMNPCSASGSMADCSCLTNWKFSILSLLVPLLFSIILMHKHIPF